MPVARPESSDSRVIAHVDMDCFYVQVEQRNHPDLRGLPTAVVQYNSYKGGSLIAVSYEARKHGVKRSMRGDEAKEVCPQIQLVQVPVARGKADLNTYRNAGSEVVSVLSKKGRCERASIDEVYLDLTEAAETMLLECPPETLGVVDEEVLKSHVLGLNNEDGKDAKESVREWLCRSDADQRDKLLACGAIIVADLRMQVLKETEFTCSAGIAHNKMLAKLASAMNKPAQQTIVPCSSVKGLLESLPIKKMKQLGGKLGSSLQSDLEVNTVGDLLQFSEEKLQQLYGVNTGTWLWNISRGINGEEVEGRLLPKSHGAGKTFPGPQALKSIPSVQQWLNELCDELNERLHSDLDQHKRIAQTLTLHARAYKSGDSDSHKKFPSKSCPLRYGTAKIQEDALNLFQAGLREYFGSYKTKSRGTKDAVWGITALSISASKIVDIPSGTHSIMKYFSSTSMSCKSVKQSEDNFVEESSQLPLSGFETCFEFNVRKSKFDQFSKIGSSTASPTYQQQEQDNHEFPGPASTSMSQVDGLSTPLSPSGSESGNTMQIERQKEAAGVGNRVDHDVADLDRLQQKGDSLKDQGKTSILRFFKNYNNSSSSSPSSSSKHKLVEGPVYSSTNLPELLPLEKKEGSINGSSGSGVESLQAQTMEQREEWRYRTDEIDLRVVDELPAEIRKEILAWLRPQKRQNSDTAKRCSTIPHYFLRKN